MVLQSTRAGTRSILLVAKKGSLEAQDAIKKIENFIKTISPNTRILFDFQKRTTKPDLVVTFGGDGTLLHAASMFSGPSPLFLPISGGTLGFMLPLRTITDWFLSDGYRRDG